MGDRIQTDISRPFMVQVATARKNVMKSTVNPCLLHHNQHYRPTAAERITFLGQNKN